MVPLSDALQAGRDGAGLNHAPVVCLVGRSGSGKTTLMEKLIPALKERGYRVGTIKHHAHAGFEIDQPGKDTWRHAKAGSDHVVIAAPDKVASIRRVERELTLAELAANMGDVDIVLVEGFKRQGTWRIEIVRSELSGEPLCAPGEAIGWASDIELPHREPAFDLNDAAGLADFIEARFLQPPGADGEAGHDA